MERILILCTGNSCRSQMAESFLKSFDSSLKVFSAGTYPAGRVHPKAVKVMKEIGITLSKYYPKSIDSFIKQPFDCVITVCDNAKETCPVFTGKVEQRFHMGFEDPSEAKGTEEEILSVFQRVRDEIQQRFKIFYEENIKNKGTQLC